MNHANKKNVDVITPIYVKTTYTGDIVKDPNISEYKTTVEAEQFIKTCLRWGIGIASCKIISKPSV